MDLISKAIPFFFLLIAVELVASWIWGRRVYRLNDSLADLCCGLFQRTSGLLLGGLLFVLYAWATENASIAPLLGTTPAAIWGFDSQLFFSGAIFQSAPWWTWLAAFLLADHSYYWAHRMMHGTSIGWATHVAHHSSEEYNLTVALRQSGTERLFSAWFYVPIALIALPWPVFVVASAIKTIYQFWIHTRLVGRLPAPIEWIFCTPSHHRVHHGRDPKYVDKNHGAILIIWDRLYGTFQKEEEEPTYGLVKPINSFNPVWAQLHVYAGMLKQTVRCRNPLDMIRTWFYPPGWRPAYLGGPIKPTEVDRQTYKPYDVGISIGIGLYALMQFVILLPMAFAVIGVYRGLTTPEQVLALGTVFLTMITLGEVLERRRWAFRVELARVGTIGVAAILAATGMISAGNFPIVVAGGFPLAAVAGGVHLVAAAWLIAMRGRFDRAWNAGSDGHDAPEPIVAAPGVSAEPVAAAGR